MLSEHGVHIASSTYYEYIYRGPSVRMLADAQVIDAIYTLRKTQPLARVLDSRKTWIKLPSNGIDVARCTLERVMGEMGWRGASMDTFSPSLLRTPAIFCVALFSIC